MLVVSRFRVAEEAGAGFADQAQQALSALADCVGFVRGRVGRAVDEPELWCLITEWASVGAYRRALSAFPVKIAATPLYAFALDEPSGYETLAASDGGELTVSTSDRAADADVAVLGDPARESGSR